VGKILIPKVRHALLVSCHFQLTSQIGVLMKITGTINVYIKKESNKCYYTEWRMLKILECPLEIS
jgi:hypothetical protein